MVSGLKVTPFLLPSYGCCRPCQASRQVCKEKQQLRGEPIWYFNPCNSMQWRPLKIYFITTTAQQFPSAAQLNFHSIDSLISGLAVATFLLPSYGCCRPCQASKQVCKETQQLEGEQISPCQGWCTYFHVTFDTNFLFASNFLKKIMINIICCFVSGLTVATRFPSSLLPNCACACCEPASRQVC